MATTTTTVHHPLDVTEGICLAHVRETGDDARRTVYFQAGQWYCADHAPAPAELPAMLAAHDAPAAPTLAARLRDIQRYARIDSETGGHRLGRWTREQTGHRDHASSSAGCSKCGGRAYAHVGPDGYNARNGAAVLARCPAVPGNRCQEMATPARTVELRDDSGDSITAGVVCGRPYLTVWQSGISSADGPGLKLCDDHSRIYRQIAAGPNAHGWRQARGPVDY